MSNVQYYIFHIYQDRNLPWLIDTPCLIENYNTSLLYGSIPSLCILN